MFFLSSESTSHPANWRIAMNDFNALFVNQREKTISLFRQEQMQLGEADSRCERTNKAVPPKVMREYQEEMNSCPLVGEWLLINKYDNDYYYNQDVKKYGKKLTISKHRIQDSFVPIPDINETVKWINLDELGSKYGRCFYQSELEGRLTLFDMREDDNSVEYKRVRSTTDEDIIKAYNEYPSDGVLPNNYAWAYGKWTIITEGNVSAESGNQQITDTNCSSADTVEVIIRYDTFQVRNIWSNYKLKYPYVELVPQITYDVFRGDKCINNKKRVSANEISLSERYYYSVSPIKLYLNNKDKSISLYSEKEIKNRNIVSHSVRNNTALDERIVRRFVNERKTTPLNGRWHSLQSRNDSLIIDFTDTRNNWSIVPLSSGKWISGNGLRNGIERLYYVRQGDLVVEEGLNRKTYDKGEKYFARKQREQQAERERQRIAERQTRARESSEINPNAIKSALTSKTFSCWKNDTHTNTTLSHEYTFMSNGTGASVLYEVGAAGKRRIGSSAIRWEVVGDKIRIYSSGVSGYSSFTLRYGTELVEEGSGNVYN